MTGHTNKVGDVVIRSKNGVRVRMIKVRDDGPPQHRWIRLARKWWEENRGRVPPGKRVLHVDGDTLNDDPENYALGGPADALAIWHDAHPRASSRNYERCRQRTGIHNRLRGEINRSRTLLPWSWYAVDLDQCVIHQGPARKRWQIWTRFGMEADAAKCRYSEGASLGWPGVGRTAACILSVLADSEWLDGEQLVARVRHFAGQRCWSCFEEAKSLHQFVWQISDQLVIRRRGPTSALYHIAPSATKARAAVCPVVPIRGRDLAASRFASFQRRGFAERIHAAQEAQ